MPDTVSLSHYAFRHVFGSLSPPADGAESFSSHEFAILKSCSKREFSVSDEPASPPINWTRGLVHYGKQFA